MINRNLAAKSTVCLKYDFFLPLADLLTSYTLFIFFKYIYFCSSGSFFSVVSKCFVMKKQQMHCSVGTVKKHWPSSCIKATFCDWWSQSLVIAMEHNSALSAHCHQFWMSQVERVGRLTLEVTWCLLESCISMRTCLGTKILCENCQTLNSQHVW